MNENMHNYIKNFELKKNEKCPVEVERIYPLQKNDFKDEKGNLFYLPFMKSNKKSN